MARGHGPVLASAMVANPYSGRARDIQPTFTICEICDRTLKTKDWGSHKNSKGHRTKEEAAKAKDNPPGGTTDAFGFGGDAGSGTGDSWAGSGEATTSSWGDDAGFGNGGDFGNDGGFDSGGFGASNSKPSGGRACFNCGQEGHNKVDCPEPMKPRGGGRACFNCGQEG
ncbi:hypothetical protein BU26DRAFT_53960 [Trematosphaeria pertusa]|uniref:CCHC-type domain-containing protein n=1 Tax=Trematosphaeria pertusa TaxID=390896 RepID=A0A6A6IA86_9PLEO|nr:uncharacterized protein BU26DRAFT_53960 [Trematosphaeria pertusa]KAF2246832.1 hypothetical protein BU26DRAFT_53960 [Trematosphaeria pertusa]